MLTDAVIAGLKDPSLVETRCYVDGHFVGERMDKVGNPATGEALGWVPRFGAAEAVEAAERAFRPWATLLICFLSAANRPHLSLGSHLISMWAKLFDLIEMIDMCEGA